jgi:MFS family permease
VARDKPRIPGAFFVVSAANFLFFVSFSLFFLLPLWVLEKGGAEEIAGRLNGISGFGGLFVLPLIGYLLDRFGRRRFLFLGAVVAACCSFLFADLDTRFVGFDEPGASWLSSANLLFGLRFIQGAAFTFAFTGAQTLAVLFAPLDRRAEAIGWFGISTILPQSFAPWMGEKISEAYGFHTLFLVAAGIGTAAMVLSACIPKPPSLMVRARKTPLDRRTAITAVAAATFAMLCYGFGFGATQTFVPIMIKRFELGDVGMFFAAWSLATVSTRLLFGSTSDRVGRRAVLIPAMLMMSTAVTLLSFVRWAPGIVGCGLIFGVAQGLLYPTMNALVADWSNPRNIGRTQSIFSGSYSMGIATCSFFFGTIVERWGYGPMFLSALAITVLGLGVFLAAARDVPADVA